MSRGSFVDPAAPEGPGCARPYSWSGPPVPMPYYIVAMRSVKRANRQGVPEKLEQSRASPAYDELLASVLKKPTLRGAGRCEVSEPEKNASVSRPRWSGATALIIAVLACASVVACTWIFGDRIVRVMQIRESDRTVSVTGSAKIRVRSDLVIWGATVSARGTTLSEAWSTLSKSTPRVRQFLIEHRVPEKEIVVDAVDTEELYDRTVDGIEIPEKIVGYKLFQHVSVTSSDLERITDVSRQVTELIEQGIEIESEPPNYLYTGLAELKIRLVSAAAQDARTRAEQVVRANHSKILGLASSRMGVVQVNAANETQVSWDGVNDVGSIDKDAFVALSAVYYVE
jgi:uncharacterized protein